MTLLALPASPAQSRVSYAREACYVSIGAALLAGAPLGAQAQAREHWSGDLRVRYENNANLDDLPSRNRIVLRGRFGVSYDVAESVTIGARLATGNSDDPKSTDVTLGSFVDDFEVSLDRAFVELGVDHLILTAGKFANPFLTTELVWDDDVNPQGVAARFAISAREVTATLRGAFAVIDEQAEGPDSHMLGSQASVRLDPSRAWRLTFAVGYYDYSIRSLVSANEDDIRSNHLSLDQSEYLSDFDLLDAIAVCEYTGFGEPYQVRVEANYVKNLGAANDEDDGLAVHGFIGRATKPGEARFGYGYAWAQTDAVLAAFSNDNTTIATNYRQHALVADYVAVPRVILQAQWYLHRRDRLGTTPTTDSGQLVSRLRLAALVRF